MDTPRAEVGIEPFDEYVTKFAMTLATTPSRVPRIINQG